MSSSHLPHGRHLTRTEHKLVHPDVLMQELKDTKAEVLALKEPALQDKHVAVQDKIASLES